MSQQHILQVSELTKKVRFMLENELNTVWLCGEISNFIAASSGHWYLSLKDSKSQVRCAMFKGNNVRVRISPKNGQQVLVRAKVSLYEPRGDFQLILEQMDDAGEGMLRQQFEALKNKLNAEGLFDVEHKKSLPKHINTLGIITSPTGAAVKDILSVLKRRNPSINVVIYPSLVQGEYAANDISQAIYIANKRKECDLLIVGRGGGSLEDLWCFNEEQVVRAIYASNIPIVSAVGHEIDTTLSDYVADLRAPTPSAAAEVVSSDQLERVEKIKTLTTRMQRSLSNMLDGLVKKQEVQFARLSRVHPQQNLERQAQRCDELTLRLTKAINQQTRTLQVRPNQLAIKLMHLSPIHRIEKQQTHVNQLEQRLNKAIKQDLKNCSERFVHLIEQLHIVSPLATIARGYSVTRNSNNHIIRSVSQVEQGDSLEIQLKDGAIKAQVVGTRS